MGELAFPRTRLWAGRGEEYTARGLWSGSRLLDRYDAITLRGPDDLAVVDTRGAALTHKTLRAAAEGFAAELLSAGLRRRDVVVLALPNVAEWQVALVACLRADLVPATVPVTTDPGNLAYLLELIKPGVVVCSADPRDASVGENVLASAASVAGTGVVRVRNDSVEWRSRPGSRQRVVPDECDQLMFTSSTTGRPKAVMHSAATLGSVNAAFAERFALSVNDPIFMPSPLGHSVGAWHGARLALWTGAPLVLQDRWDPEAAGRLLREHRCSFTAAATPFLTDLVETGAVVDDLRTFLCGGAPVPPSLVDRSAAVFPRALVSVLWGMTEGGVTTCERASPADKRRATAGLPLPGLELRVLGDDGPDGAGELVMRGPGVCLGYAGQPELFEQQLTDDAFLRTGDLAVLEPDGYLRVTGRLKDLVIRGGVNISPIPIEDALAAHPRIRAVAVIGVPDPRMGERIGAVVSVDGAEPLELDELCQWLDARGLPRRQWPERLFLVAEMPRTPAGKIRKNVLRKTVAAEAEVTA
ncbi:MAG: AMP-binding protein [Streptosporangiales bacterium]|nr:AMP-binding protein [Streptosporangiales bacterium]